MHTFWYIFLFWGWNSFGWRTIPKIAYFSCNRPLFSTPFLPLSELCHFSSCLFNAPPHPVPTLFWLSSLQKTVGGPSRTEENSDGQSCSLHAAGPFGPTHISSCGYSHSHFSVICALSAGCLFPLFSEVKCCSSSQSFSDPTVSHCPANEELKEGDLLMTSFSI